jgi:hypothetical protein
MRKLFKALFFVFLLCAIPFALNAQTAYNPAAPKDITVKYPDFPSTFMTAIEKLKPGEIIPLSATEQDALDGAVSAQDANAKPENLSSLYLRRALTEKVELNRAAAFLDAYGDRGAQDKKRLLGIGNAIQKSLQKQLAAKNAANAMRNQKKSYSSQTAEDLAKTPASTNSSGNISKTGDNSMSGSLPGGKTTPVDYSKPVISAGRALEIANAKIQQPVKTSSSITKGVPADLNGLDVDAKASDDQHVGAAIAAAGAANLAKQADVLPQVMQPSAPDIANNPAAIEAAKHLEVQILPKRPVFAAKSRSWTDPDASASSTTVRDESTLPGAQQSRFNIVPESWTDSDSKYMKIITVPLSKLNDIASEQVYNEREEDLNKAYGTGSYSNLVGGAGAFKVKIMDPDEINADPVKKQVVANFAKLGQKVSFVRTDIKAQLFTGVSAPINIAAGVTGSANVQISGIVEVVETRAVPHDAQGAWLSAKRRVFLWPLTAEHIKKDMRVGEDLTITGRVQDTVGGSIGIGQQLGSFQYGAVGASATAGASRTGGKWISLHIKKIDLDHVTAVIQEGTDRTVSENVQARAGVDIDSDDFMPQVSESVSITSSVYGWAAAQGKKAVINELDKIADVEFSLAFSQTKAQTSTEGWGSVSLDDDSSTAALDSMFKFNFKPMQGLQTNNMYNGILGAGHFVASSQDVTNNKELQLRLSLLHFVSKKGTTFSELQWESDGGKVNHYLVGKVYADSSFDPLSEKRHEESILWYNVDTGEYSITVDMGPDKRTITTTAETVNDVVAAQKGFGIPVDGHINPPSVPINIFGLGNYGKSNETGYFTVTPNGMKSMKDKTPEDMMIAYLKADWLFERENNPPGKSIFNNSKPPLWVTDAAAPQIRPALKFLSDNFSAIDRARFGDKDDREDMSDLNRAYAKISPGRDLVGDWQRFRSAAAFARRVMTMQQNEDKPEQAMDMFMAFRHDSNIDLKHATVAMTYLVGSTTGANGVSIPNYTGYMEMTGSRVSLKPVGIPDHMPLTPLQQLSTVLDKWNK